MLTSVIIPTHNYARYVIAAVESVLRQSRPAHEIIVVDDGSTDDTADALRPFREEIRYVWQPNGGISAARNAGIRLAHGELVAFLDADDVWCQWKLEYQIPIFEKNRDLGLLATRHVKVSEPSWPPTFARPISPVPATPVTLDKLIVKSRFGVSGVVLRKSCLDEVGWFDEGLASCEDRDYWLRTAASWPIAIVDAELWAYRIHGGSWTQALARVSADEARTELVLSRALSAHGSRVHAAAARRGRSMAALFAAYAYSDSGELYPALKRGVASLRHWPLPHSRSDLSTSFARPKFLFSVVRRMLSVRRFPSTARPR
jgi:hypothetical protein